jgi:hypothetical protein
MNVCNDDWKHLMCIEGAWQGLRAQGNEMIEMTKHEWEEMED